MYNPRPLIEHWEDLQSDILREIERRTKPETGMQVSNNSPFTGTNIRALYALRAVCRNAIADNELIVKRGPSPGGPWYD